MLLICPFGVFFSPVSFAKAPWNSYVEPDLFSQHDLATFWLCVEIRFRNQQQTECNTRKLCWFDFSCTRGFLVSCNQKKIVPSLRRKRECFTTGSRLIQSPFGEGRQWPTSLGMSKH